MKVEKANDDLTIALSLKLSSQIKVLVMWKMLRGKDSKAADEVTLESLVGLTIHGYTFRCLQRKSLAPISTLRSYSSV